MFSFPFFNKKLSYSSNTPLPQPQPNKDFFKQSNGQYNELCITNSSIDPFLLYFGASEGSRHFTLNSVKIVPLGDTTVKVNIHANGRKFEFEIRESTDIFQQQYHNSYDICLVVGDEKISKDGIIWNGTISIVGSCDIIQTGNSFRDN
jgi:hypothetical protein